MKNTYVWSAFLGVAITLGLNAQHNNHDGHNHAGHAAATVHNYGDSLKGLNVDSLVRITQLAHLSKGEAENYLATQKRNYVDIKYGLGDAPDYLTGYNWPQNPVAACTNLDFETGDFTGWTGAIGDNNNNSLGPMSNIQNGIFTAGQNAAINNANARHTIMTAAAGNDPCGGFPIVPPGYGNYVVRMGNNTANYQGSVLEQTFTVDPQSTNFTYRYAVVLNDGGHLPNEQPYFKIEVLDQSGQPVSQCAQYFVTAGSSAQGFMPCPNDPMTYYRPWTTVAFDLLPYVNQNVTVRFTVAGCIYSGHYGYAYIDASCSSIADAVAARFCPGSPGAFLTAPGGFGSYQWFDPNGNPIPGATNDSLLVPNAMSGDTFSVEMVNIADTSCNTFLQVVIELTPLETTISSTDPTCWNYNDGAATSGCNNCIPPTSFIWNSVPPQVGPVANGLGWGTYIVTMTDSIGCTESDTVILNNPARLDTAGITTQFCFGDEEITLIGLPGMQGYQWFGPDGQPIPGATSQQYLVVSPQLGQEYSVVYQTNPCPIYDSIILSYIPPSPLFMPDTTVNIFTPNGDQRNDYFYPYYDETVAGQAALGIGTPQYDFELLYVGAYEIWVYNRWGEEVFYTNDYNIGWDGKINGKDASEGVYFWVAKFQSRCKLDMEPIEHKGFVHLKR
jgi:hypothetical protein